MPDKSLEDILNRSLQEKLLAVEAIWDKIAEDSDKLPVVKKHIDVVMDRKAEYMKNPSRRRKWEDFKKDFLGDK